MTILKDYDQFTGRHWETGSVHNHLAYQGVKAPHTGEPYSEALLLGVSGGVVMGYFSFAYEGYDPMARILTRNTFDPLERILSRLGVVQNVLQTTNPVKGKKNLLDLIESGVPPIAWADYYWMPYNALAKEAGMWAMFPLVVYGYDEAGGVACIADRSRVPLVVSTQVLDEGRARVKKDKFRLVELEPPNPSKLNAAVKQGIWDCIRLFTEKPPKGGRDNFGFAAYQRWAEVMVKPNARESWRRVFPPGEKMYAGLCSAFTDIRLFGKGEGESSAADRGLYADFLEEASLLLELPALNEAAGLFRKSGRAWQDLSEALLPDGIEGFGETRRLMLKRQALFLDQGMKGLEEMEKIDVRLREIKAQMKAHFPLDEAGVTNFSESVREHVLKVQEVELEAVEKLRQAMG
jgi:hypothetical protein